MPVATLNRAFVDNRGRAKGVTVVAVVDGDGALVADDQAAHFVVDRAATDCDGFIEAVGPRGQTDRLDGSEIVDGHLAVDIDAVAVSTVHGMADNRAGRRVIDDRGGGVPADIQVDAGAILAGDRAAVVDGDRRVAGDAVARAIDRHHRRSC